MLQEVIDLQNRSVVNLLYHTSKKDEVTFKAPTGSGKTHMMADFMITSEFESPTRMDITQDLKNALFHMFDMSTTAYISDLVQLSVYFSYVGGIKNEKFTCKTKKNRMELKEQFERAICEFEERQNLNQLPVTRYRFHTSHVKFYNNTS